jgi:hypothetical protein
LLIAASLAGGQAFAQTSAAGNVYDLLVGTYTGSGKSEGIYVYRIDTETGRATLSRWRKPSIRRISRSAATTVMSMP